MLNEQQQKAVDLACQGHSFFLTGSAGTGKSYVMCKIAEELENIGRNVVILTPTGIAATVYQRAGLKAFTVHRWAGLLGGRFSNEELEARLLNDENMIKVKENISSKQVILLDEISMLSKHIFEQLQLVCCSVKGRNEYFGGMQVVGCGDFNQLSPVRNYSCNDPGSFSFESEIWKKVFPHKLHLFQVLRQDEIILINAVSETARGDISPETDQFLTNMTKPLHPSVNKIRLCATNYRAQIYNRECFGDISSGMDVKNYSSEDSGSVKDLKRILAPKRLVLKPGVPVMLLRNLSDRLMNGMMGSVVECSEDTLRIYFHDLQETHPITRHHFVVYSSMRKQNIATRLQFPVCLAYAVTIHKSQGQTFDHVEVDCTGIFAPGQLSVAIGRARSIQGLHVLAYNKDLCLPHPDKVQQFHQEMSQEIFDDLSCCEIRKKKSTVAQNDCDTFHEQNVYDYLSDDSDFDENDLKAIDEMEEDHIFSSLTIPQDQPIPNEELVTFLNKLDAVTTCKLLLIDNCITQTQSNFNIAILQILKNEEHLKNWMKTNVSKIMEISNNIIPNAPTEKTNPKMWSCYMQNTFQHIRSNDYQSSLSELFQTPVTLLSDVHYQVGYKLFSALLHLHLEEMAQGLRANETRKDLCPYMSDAGRGKVRYVAGMCIAKLKHHEMNIVSHNIFNNSNEKDIKSSIAKVEMLSSLERSFDFLIHRSNDTTSLYETERKQNVRRSLTNICDEAFNFFQQLCQEIESLLCKENLDVHGQDIFRITMHTLTESEELNSKWNELFHECDSTIVTSMFENVVRRFLRVMAKQFRKDVKDEMNLKKDMAHRKQVKEKNEKAKEKSTLLSMNDIQESSNHELIHLKLKISQIESTKQNMLQTYTCDQLKNLSQAYMCPFTANMRKEKLIENLSKEILKCSLMPDPEALQGKCPKRTSTSTSLTNERDQSNEKPKKKMCLSKPKNKGKGKGRGKKTKKYICPECKEECLEQEPCIQCDKCDSWVHRMCGEIHDESDWAKYCLENIEWICPKCV